MTIIRSGFNRWRPSTQRRGAHVLRRSASRPLRHAAPHINVSADRILDAELAETNHEVELDASAEIAAFREQANLD